MKLDRASLLVEVPGTATLRDVEDFASPLTLDVWVSDVTVAAWLAAGAPGAPSGFEDPADHLVAGLVARLHDGRRIEIRPSPRRAVGPDLAALVLGAHERFAVVESAWLRVHVAPRTRRPLELGPLDPAVSADEARLLDAIARALAGQ